VRKFVADVGDAMLIAGAAAAVARLPGMRWSLHSGGGIILIVLLAGAVLYIPSTGFSGRTIGKLLLGLRVVPVDGRRVPGLIRAATRYVFVLPSMLGLFRFILPVSVVQGLDGLRSRGSKTVVVSTIEWEALRVLSQSERASLLQEALDNLEDDSLLSDRLLAVGRTAARG
jgi:hypothetical protein